MGNIFQTLHAWSHIPFIEFDHDNPSISIIDHDEGQPETKPKQFEPKPQDESGFKDNNHPNEECNTADYPLYDPNYFDDFCSDKFWCFKYYDS